MSINTEKQKIKEIREYNRQDSRAFSNYAMDVYEASLEQNIKKVKRK